LTGLADAERHGKSLVTVTYEHFAVERAVIADVFDKTIGILLDF